MTIVDQEKTNTEIGMTIGRMPYLKPHMAL